MIILHKLSLGRRRAVPVTNMLEVRLSRSEIPLVSLVSERGRPGFGNFSLLDYVFEVRIRSTMACNSCDQSQLGPLLRCTGCGGIGAVYCVSLHQSLDKILSNATL